jgi:drug/metabolite transporter (DMT)-like permease
MQRENLWRGLAWVGLTVVCWAPLFSVAKRTLPQLDAYALGSARYLVGVALLVALLAALEGRRALSYEGRFTFTALVGLIGVTGFNLFVWIGLGYTLPEHVSIILALQTPLTALVVWATRGQRPAAFTLGCVTVAFAGVVLVITKGDARLALDRSQLFGDALVFGAVISWVTYTLSAARFAAWSPLRFTVLTCIPGGAGLLVANVVAVALGAAALPTWGALAGVGWQLVYLSVGTVVLGIIGFNAATRRLGPLNTLLMLNLVPVCVFGIEASLGRSFTAAELAGAATVIAALMANNLYLRAVDRKSGH